MHALAVFLYAWFAAEVSAQSVVNGLVQAGLWLADDSFTGARATNKNVVSGITTLSFPAETAPSVLPPSYELGSLTHNDTVPLPPTIPPLATFCPEFLPMTAMMAGNATVASLATFNQASNMAIPTQPNSLNLVDTAFVSFGPGHSIQTIAPNRPSFSATQQPSQESSPTSTTSSASFATSAADSLTTQALPAVLQSGRFGYKSNSSSSSPTQQSTPTLIDSSAEAPSTIDSSMSLLSLMTGLPVSSNPSVAPDSITTQSLTTGPQHSDSAILSELGSNSVNPSTSQGMSANSNLSSNTTEIVSNLSIGQTTLSQNPSSSPSASSSPELSFPPSSGNPQQPVHSSNSSAAPLAVSTDSAIISSSTGAPDSEHNFSVSSPTDIQGNPSLPLTPTSSPILSNPNQATPTSMSLADVTSKEGPSTTGGHTNGTSLNNGLVIESSGIRVAGAASAFPAASLAAVVAGLEKPSLGLDGRINSTQHDYTMGIGSQALPPAKIANTNCSLVWFSGITVNSTSFNSLLDDAEGAVVAGQSPASGIFAIANEALKFNYTIVPGTGSLGEAAFPGVVDLFQWFRYDNGSNLATGYVNCTKTVAWVGLHYATDNSCLLCSY